MRHLLTCLSRYFGESVSTGLYEVGYSPFYYLLLVRHDELSFARVSQLVHNQFSEVIQMCKIQKLVRIIMSATLKVHRFIAEWVVLKLQSLACFF